MPSGSNGLGAAAGVLENGGELAGDGFSRLDRPIEPVDAEAELSLCELASAPVREAVASGLFAGVVTGLALPDGRTQIQAVGRRDLESGEAMAPDTLFWIASLTKSMTSTLVMMLVEEGKIALDAPVERYLPEFGRQAVLGWFGLAAKPRRPATVVELLRHLSGLPANLPPDERPLDRMTLAEKSRLCGGLRLVSQPGESHLYSNLNYEALGRLIEVVSGDSFETFLQERLLDPLGMGETTFRPTAAQLDRLALPYASEGEPGSLARRPFTLVSEPFDDAERQPTPAFGLFSTAEDCLRFCRLHLQHGEWQGRRLFSNATAAQMLRRFEGPVGAEYRGLAWSVAPGAACMTGAYGTWMTLHLRLDVASVFLSASADFWQSVPQEACRAFVGNVGAELRQERLARRRRTAAARPHAANRRRPVRQPVER